MEVTEGFDRRTMMSISFLEPSSNGTQDLRGNPYIQPGQASKEKVS